ncbi:hypothetical protein F5890DRAFT_1554448 [Lentinula detonsa]|uniref:AAA+ ATPase domain-containing protein n=1 Tax=Lentinula detonsa TaxID=2804962 RepID=A0AA38PYQ8_9AGAR|nr:hypothetical protein F5890DRAFT_1554448 [Lentinula detonsa]
MFRTREDQANGSQIMRLITCTNDLTRRTYLSLYISSSEPDSMPLTTPGHNKLRRSSRHTSQQTIGSMHWLFRTNIPRRRSSYYPSETRKRNFFGFGEIVSVLANPAETVRSLTESKRLLEEARQEINENRERSQIRPKHTFSRLPGFFARRAEARAIERALEGEPAFTVLFGASSVGKTALLREVLCRDSYHVLHFDLRIAGFADLASLYMSLSRQMEQYFEAISTQMEGYKEFEKEAWSFKHDRLNVERRMLEVPPDSGVSRVKTSDIARLMELFQSSLLKYWEFDPHKEDREGQKRKHEEQPGSSSKSRFNSSSADTKRESNKFRNLLHLRSKHEEQSSKRPAHERRSEPEKEAEGRERPAKKMPVVFFDEAHKLPALIQSTDAMNCLLSAFLVLTKQDRLCHVIHATSDPFYHTWLRQLNVMQHCKILTVGDCSKAETRAFFREQMLPRVPEDIRFGLNFEVLYDAFGGKLVHWQDFVTDYVNSNGRLDVRQSSHFLQAHALLNLHIIHSSEHPPVENEGQESNPNPTQPSSSSRLPGFKIYSAISNPRGPDAQDADGSTTAATYGESDFSALQLLRVISRITEPGTTYLPYFALCREYGVHAVDGMVKGRMLDLRWTEPVTKESEPEETSYINRRSRPLSIEGGESNGRTLVDNSNHLEEDAAAASEEDIVPVPEQEVFSHNRRRRSSRWKSVYEGNMDSVIGPKLVPTTPIMKYAMREVLREYDEGEVVDGDDITVSEYASAASLSDVEEY